MTQPPRSPAWASTAVSGLVAGPPREAFILASTGVASYAAVREHAAPAVVLALLSRAAVRLPIGVCVATGPLPEAGTAVRIGDGLVVTPRQAWHPVRWWDPRPRLDAGALRRYGPRLRRAVLDAPTKAFGLPLPDAFAVAGALAAGDPEPAVRVLGLGPGLTPAADDVIAGALAALTLTGRLSGFVRHTIETRAATRTTGLSAALLRAAGRGAVIPAAARVLTVLAAGEPADRVNSAAAGLFRVGSTSGHDLCAGLAGALTIPSSSAGER